MIDSVAPWPQRAHVTSRDLRPWQPGASIVKSSIKLNSLRFLALVLSDPAYFNFGILVDTAASGPAAYIVSRRGLVL